MTLTNNDELLLSKISEVVAPKSSQIYWRKFFDTHGLKAPKTFNPGGFLEHVSSSNLREVKSVLYYYWDNERLRFALVLEQLMTFLLPELKISPEQLRNLVEIHLIGLDYEIAGYDKITGFHIIPKIQNNLSQSGSSATATETIKFHK